MIEPTVGRILWYYVKDHKRDEQPLAAIIAHVWSPTCINIGLLLRDGAFSANPPQRVRLVQDNEVVPNGGGFCTWMPYQIGQAAKTGALQEQLKGSTEDPKQSSVTRNT